MFLEFIKTLNFYYSFSIAFLPSSIGLFYGVEEYIQSSPSYSTELEIKITSPKEYLFIGGGSEVYMTTANNGNLKFAPLQDSFIFNVGASLEKIELGFEHYCTHPFAHSVNNEGLPMAYYGSYSKIYIKISGNTKRR